MAAPGQQAKKTGPEWMVRLPPGPTRLRRETAFLANIKFKNDLPEIPCDPKLLLPPYNKEEIAAFKLTELEKDLQHELLFEPDLGIPIHPWNIEQYSVPPGSPPPLHPDDMALVQSDDEAGAQRARKAAEVSWLLRTKYIAAEAGLRRGGAAAQAKPEAAAAADEQEDPRERRLQEIEEQFAAAKVPLVHGRDPSITPVEVLPVFPDSLLEGRPCVLATFDADPLADVDALEALALEQRGRVPQAMQLKSFKPPSGPQFVALLVPRRMPEPGDDELSAAGGIPGRQLAREYSWVREYQPQPRLDEKSTTYLFRFANDGTVRFHDLNTRLELRKRKRQVARDEEGEGEGFVQPEMVVVRDPETGEYAEQQEAGQGAEGQQDGGAGGSPLQQQQQQQPYGAGEDGGSGDVGMADGGSPDAAAGLGSRGEPEDEDFGGPADANAALRDAFGDEDDDI